MHGLPGDEHSHDCCFAGAGRELQRDPQQLGVGVFVGAAKVGPDPAAGGDRKSVV